MRVLVGGLNQPAPEVPARGVGITAFDFDEATGTLRERFAVGGVDNPSFLVISPDQRTLYATLEVEGASEGGIAAFRVEAEALRYINQQPTSGTVPAHASLDPSGRFLLVANYRVGAPGTRGSAAVAVFPVEPDGGLAPAVSRVFHEGSGPDAGRQEGPHPHCVAIGPDGRVAVADLGTDRVVVYDLAEGVLTRVAEVAMPPGSGPRHLAWARGFLHVTGELDNTVMAIAWEPEPRYVGAVSTLPAGWRGESFAADLRISTDSRFLYASNRGCDGIAAFAIGADGALASIGHTPTPSWPRNFALDPSGRFVLVACQHDDEVTVFSRDAESGALGKRVGAAAVGTPMGLVFAAPASPREA